MKKELLEKILKHTSEHKSIDKLHTLYFKKKIDVNPPYQREVVWNNEYRSNLITSIFSKYPLPPLTFVETEHKTGNIVLDGKQRITAICDYIDNKFGAIHPELGDQKKYKFDELQNSTNDTLQKIASDFTDYNLSIVQFPWMPLSEQRDLFMVLNHSKELANNDKIYCKYFLTKALLNHIWELTLHEYSTILKAPLVNANSGKEKRSSCLRYLHDILFQIYGFTFDSSPEINAVRKNTIEKSSEKLEGMLLNNGFTCNSVIDKEFFKKIGIYDNIMSFISISKSIKEILEFTPITNKWTNLVVRDVLIFFSKLNNQNIFTLSQLKNKKEDVYNVLLEYAKSNAAIYNVEGSKDKKSIESRLDSLKNIFYNYCKEHEIDLNEKRKEFTENEKILAKLNSSIKCPICNTVLTNENVHVDHINPKSSFSQSVVSTLCKTCNMKKNNWTKEEFDKYSCYSSEYGVK